MILKSIFEKLFKIREDANRQREQSLRPGADDGYDPYEKPFLDHLEDLRKTIGKMLTTVMIATILAFAFNKQIFAFALLPLTIDLLGLSDGPPLREFIQFLTLSPQEILMLSIKVAFFAGLIASFPLLVYFGGEFILPGLKRQEKKYVLPGVGAGFVLFLIGASFAFFLAAPIALKFFYEFQLERLPLLNPAATAGETQTLTIDELVQGGTEALEADPEATGEDKPAVVDPAMKSQVVTILRELFATPKDSELSITYDPTLDRFIFSNTPIQMVSYRIGDYINFITRLTLVFGLSFQLPVVVVILVKLQLLTARVMRSTRAYAWVIMLVASAIFTPPDIFTLALLAGPLVLLYEICIWIATAMEAKRARVEKAEEEERETRLSRLYGKPADDLTEEEKQELHQHEIDQYEAEHADLYEEDSGHIEHDPHHHEDEQGHDHDPHHDESWHDPHHDEHGHYIGDGHEHDPDHDPHHGEADHEPVQDWPDRPEDGASSDSGAVTGEEEEKPEAAEDEFHDDDVCEPEGPVVNLNTATEEELKTLPRIGPAMAKRIIEHRPYASFDDVSNVPGLGDETLYAIMDRLSIDEPEEEEEEDADSEVENEDADSSGTDNPDTDPDTDPDADPDPDPDPDPDTNPDAGEEKKESPPDEFEP